MMKRKKKMKYVIMCGTSDSRFPMPRQLFKFKDEPIIERTIRLLRANGVDDIAISTNFPQFEYLDVPLLHHNNKGLWVNAFYPTGQPTCYILGDVVFSENAIKTIVETDTDDIEFFASAPPFSSNYPKRWAEPFAFKVKDFGHLFGSVEEVKRLYSEGAFRRHPIAWELWQVIKGTPINKIDYTNYTVINDYTCDVDYPCDLVDLGRLVEG